MQSLAAKESSKVKTKAYFFCHTKGFLFKNIFPITYHSGHLCLSPMALVPICGKPMMHWDSTLPNTESLCLVMTTLVTAAPLGEDATAPRHLRKPSADPLWSTALPERHL